MEPCITVKMVGGYLTVSDKQSQIGIGSTKGTKRKHKRKTAESNARGVRRTKVALAQFLQNIKNTPLHHISVVMPREIVAQQHESRLFVSFIDQFVSTLKSQYPDGYFVKIFGFNVVGRLHIHLVGRFGLKCNRKQKQKELLKLWQSIVRSDKDSLLCITKYDSKGTLGYFTSPDKDDEFFIARKELADKRVWSVISKKNIVFHEKHSFNLTPIEYKKFKKILIKVMLEENIQIPSYITVTADKHNYCLNYLTKELLDRVLSKFKKWRSHQ